MGDPFGRTVIAPFRLDPRGDPSTADGLRNLRAALRQVLGTRATTAAGPGEVRWKPAFGSRLEILRHRGNDASLAALAEELALEALSRWEPRLDVTGVEVEADGATLRLRVSYRPVTGDPSAPVVEEASVEVTL